MPTSDFDFLAKNQSLTLTYNIKVSDNHGGFVTQTVKITVTGTDDKPVVAVEPITVVTEQANQTLSLSPDIAHIQLDFTDVDLINTGHTASVTGVTATGNTSGLLPGSLGTAEVMAFFQVDNVVKNSGSSTGVINTTFAAPDLAFDYLAAGEQLNLAYTVQLDDHAGGISTQNRQRHGGRHQRQAGLPLRTGRCAPDRGPGPLAIGRPHRERRSCLSPISTCRTATRFRRR